MGDQKEEEQKIDMWKLVFGFVEMAVVKCAIQLGIAETIESHGNPMTVSELSSALGCDPSYLNRIMRFLAHHHIFKEMDTIPEGSKSYSQTTISRLLMRSHENSIAPLILLESSPVMLAPWQILSVRVLDKGPSPFEAANGKDLWSYAAANPTHNQLLNDGMACVAKSALPAIIDGCLDVFNGIGTVVDVGGGNGTTLGKFVKACPWIKGINFDLPHVLSSAPKYDGVEHVGGDMFDTIPKADATFLMSVLHDWGDEDCIRILKNCREAVPEDKGKVIIVEAVIDKEKINDAGLILDMVMMAHTTTGRERSLEEWTYVLGEAGFNRHAVRSIAAVPSIIEAFPC
ncbi:hypothetical protein UlMin_031022 [Ulmus minor]